MTPDGQKAPKTYLPNLSLPGAVKTGEVEMIAAMTVKATKSAAVLRGIKVVLQQVKCRGIQNGICRPGIL